MQQPQPTIGALYPQARKLQFELKMQMSYLESGRTGQQSDHELQQDARQNLTALQELLWRLESLVQLQTHSSERETWVKYVALGWRVWL